MVLKFIKKFYNKAFHSIGFWPSAMTLLFVSLAIVFLKLDESSLGAELISRIKWLTLKDAATANSILSTIATGIISLTVFSFSMVMIVMAQAASQMSNRMLDNIIGDKTQKTILGCYIGTLIYTFLVFTKVSEAESATVPTLSIYFLILLTVLDIFLFIYFLHHITQTFRYEQQIKRLQEKGVKALNNLEKLSKVTNIGPPEGVAREIACPQSNYYMGFDRNALLTFAQKNEVVIEFLHTIGTFVLKGLPLLKVYGGFSKDEELLEHLDFYHGQEIDKNAYYGFFHLTEVAVKALSPGINDPGTAVLAINALTDLFARVITSPIQNTLVDDDGAVRIITRQRSVEELFELAVLPIWDYGKEDRLIKAALQHMIRQLLQIEGSNRIFLQKWLQVFEKTTT